MSVGFIAEGSGCGATTKTLVFGSTTSALGAASYDADGESAELPTNSSDSG